MKPRTRNTKGMRLQQEEVEMERIPFVFTQEKHRDAVKTAIPIWEQVIETKSRCACFPSIKMQSRCITIGFVPTFFCEDYSYYDLAGAPIATKYDKLFYQLL